jgi:23S rRNA pseudouridine1911/1915/1917 synthase
MALVESGKESSSDVELINYYQGYSFVKITPHTGRTHQIRVHLQAAKAPILGDPLYGIIKINEQLHISHQMLHAHRLRFTHPITCETLTLTAPLPQDMLALQTKLLLK